MLYRNNVVRNMLKYVFLYASPWLEIKLYVMEELLVSV